MTCLLAAQLRRRWYDNAEIYLRACRVDNVSNVDLTRPFDNMEDARQKYIDHRAACKECQREVKRVTA